MRLRIPGLLAMVAIFCVTEPAVASAQQPAKAWRIGLLDYAASDPAGAARWKAFREGLRELGYVEGQGVVFEARWGDGQTGRLRGLVTGVISLIGALAEKRLELFKQSIPRASRVAILRKPENRSSAVSPAPRRERGEVLGG